MTHSSHVLLSILVLAAVHAVLGEELPTLARAALVHLLVETLVALVSRRE